MNPIATEAIITNPVYIFLVVLCIILLAPMLLNRLKIPHIIGLIVAGVVVGPFGIHLLDRDSSFSIFGQVGILYLMFLAGLEIDMFHLKKNLRSGLIFGMYTFLVPLVIGVATSIYLLGMDWVAAVLLASMYASHTLIAYPIVSRFGISKYNAVVVAITGTIVAVLSSLIVLAIIVGVHHDGEFSIMAQLKLLGQLAVYLAIIIYSYPRLTRWFFRSYNDNVMQFVFVIALVLLASAVSQTIGIESVLGAFFAGLVLNRYIPSASSLMTRIEFVGNAIFIPYFLIGVGMLINVRILFSNWATLYVALVMVAVATSTKWLAAWLTQKNFKMGALDRKIIFGLSNAHVAAALAAVMIGYNGGIFDDVVLNGTILMILVSCTIATVVTENVSVKIKEKMISEGEQGPLDKSAGRYRRRSRILVNVSNPLTAASLVNLAILSRTKNNQNPIFGLHVRNDNGSNAVARAANVLDVAEKCALEADVKFTPIDRFDMNTVMGIINTVNERDITDVVVGLHQRGTVVDSFYGNIIEQLVNQLHKTVIISRCFIPLNTVARIVVSVPPKAEYETGFRYWLIKLCNIAGQLGCRIIFCASQQTQPYIRGVIHEQKFEVRAEFRETDDWDDFVLLSNKILDDDLFVVVSARRSSMSFSKDMDRMPGFLSIYFSHNNLLIIYPEQFGEMPIVASFNDPLVNELGTAPTGVWLKILGWYKWLVIQKKRITHRNRKQRRIDL